MKIIIGNHAGFCYGVKRAVAFVSDFAQEGIPCATLGPLIHNPQEVARLSRAGVRCISNPEEVRTNERLIIRSHGVSPEVMERAKAVSSEVVDLTCPHVAHIHQLVSEAEPGYTIVIIGEADHPEVQGIAGWARRPVLVVSSVQETKETFFPGHLMVVAQTTLREETFESILFVLKQRVEDIRIYRTICAATSQRQKEAEILSAKADITFVVGGSNSSNTRKLYETCKMHCSHTFLIETEEDIPHGLINRDDTVALTAGASTPQWLLERVYRKILSIGGA